MKQSFMRMKRRRGNSLALQEREEIKIILSQKNQINYGVKVLQEISIKNLNHLGIIAGIIDEIDIVNIVNRELGIEEQEIELWLTDKTYEIL
jgi:hypothetical protein